ncbi:hypothetical protein F5J12DRAFT_787577 [Pisolithus orientalis]|uniref:uncharacterized protein n=1 Tax=Pisolithus orientalis TaxID=936130 RepID=UPI0022245601|nr:uncharacterized protein F5J12DRAFT_787577 [Pisolithus orientalis]KAI5984396.1 hypothetical protein F5J12DRAFT_787577 [Pisolithus orientalis]
MPMNEIRRALDDLVLGIMHIEAGSCMSPRIISGTDSIDMKLPTMMWAHLGRRGKSPTTFLPEAFRFCDPYFSSRQGREVYRWAKAGKFEQVDKLGYTVVVWVPPPQLHIVKTQHLQGVARRQIKVTYQPKDSVSQCEYPSHGVVVFSNCTSPDDLEKSQCQKCFVNTCRVGRPENLECKMAFLRFQALEILFNSQLKNPRKFTRHIHLRRSIEDVSVMVNNDWRVEACIVAINITNCPGMLGSQVHHPNKLTDQQCLEHGEVMEMLQAIIHNFSVLVGWTELYKPGHSSGVVTCGAAIKFFLGIFGGSDFNDFTAPITVYKAKADILMVEDRHRCAVGENYEVADPF